MAATPERASSRRGADWFSSNRPAAIALGILLVIFVLLLITHGFQDVFQTGLNGLTLGSVVALAAVGLTLVYGILKLVNFAHGDFLTFGAYIGFLINVTWGLPLVIAVVGAMAGTAALGLFFERVMWKPMRAKGAGLLQLLLMSIGLAFLLRAVIQFIWGTKIRGLDVNTTDTISLLGVRQGTAFLLVILVGVAILIGTGLVLRYSLFGKQMRAVADDIDLAETSGINTERTINYTWLFSGALAGLAGVLLAVYSNLKPELGFEVLLPIFAAVVLGGIGNAFGALAAGLVLGVMIEWSTLVIDSGWKFAVGFVVLILVLVVRPQGIFGQARAV